MHRSEFALHSLRCARGYVQTLLDSVPEDRWFEMPGGITHVAWQVGHLAVSQARLVFVRVLGEPEDLAGTLPDGYASLFGKGSAPLPDAAAYPTLGELRGAFNGVYSRVLVTVPTLTESLLCEPVANPHPAFDDKFGALLWAARHELVHAGQIGLLRRLMGGSPLR